MLHILLLFLPGVLGGMINAIAGGGGLLLYPALLASGLSPIIANASASLIVLPGSVTSAFGYRKEISSMPKNYIWLLLAALVGGLIGATILIHTKPDDFSRLAPWLVLSAVLLLALQSRIHRFLSSQTKKRKLHWHTLPLLFIAVVPLTIYGSFFGVGFGLMMLAVLGFSNLKNVHQINGLKNLCGIVMSTESVIYFSRAGLIHYSSALMMACGTAVGGYLGARFAHKISTHVVHDLIVVIGLAIAIVLIIKS